MQLLKVLSINLFTLLLLLGIIEAGLRFAYPDYTYYYRSHPAMDSLEVILSRTDTQWLQPHPLFGWVCQSKSNLGFPSPPVPSVAYQINKEGFRNPFHFSETTHQQKKRVLLLGDSFLFGIYLPEEETIAHHLRSDLGSDYIFYNLAVPAWGLDQMYLAYQYYVDRINPDQVIFAFVDDDLMRTREILFHGCGLKPSFKLVENNLKLNTENPAYWETLCWNNHTGNFVLKYYHEKKAAELAHFIFSDIIKNEQLNQRQPIFLRIPAQVDLDQHNAREHFSMKTLMKKEEVKYLELFDSLHQQTPKNYRPYFIPDDGHPTAAGAKMIADHLLNLMTAVD